MNANPCKVQAASPPQNKNEVVEQDRFNTWAATQHRPTGFMVGTLKVAMPPSESGIASLVRMAQSGGDMTLRQFCTWMPLLGLTLHAVSAPQNPTTPLSKIRIAKDGRTFETEFGKPFVPFGLTYYRPGTGWAPQVWKKFDVEATRADFARLKELGVTCVRVFLTWGSFCPTSNTVSAEALAKFDQFLALAEGAGIYVHPTGPDHWEGVPGWLQDEDIVGDQRLAALEVFWGQFAARYRARPGIFAYDLRNEPEVPWTGATLNRKWNLWLGQRYAGAEPAAKAWGSNATTLAWGRVPPPPPRDALTNRMLLDYQQFREEIADEWTRRQVTAIKAADPAALVTVGLIQWSVPALLPGVQHYAGFRPQRQARYLDFLEVHFYPLEHGFYSYAGVEDEARNLAYAQSVVAEVASVGKPVVLAEFGWYGGGQLTIDQGRHPAATEEQQAGWNRHLIEATAGLAVGWLNWGFYDQPEARDVSQLTGLLTADGKTKAWGREFQKLAARYAGQVIPPRRLGARPALDWGGCLTSQKTAEAFRTEYWRAFQADQAR